MKLRLCLHGLRTNERHSRNNLVSASSLQQYSQFYGLLYNLLLLSALQWSAVRPTKVGQAGSPKLIPRSDHKNENGLTRARARGSLTVRPL